MHREKMQEQEIRHLEIMIDMLETISRLFNDSRHDYVMGNETCAREKLESGLKMVDAFAKLVRTNKC